MGEDFSWVIGIRDYLGGTKLGYGNRAIGHSNFLGLKLSWLQLVAFAEIYPDLHPMALDKDYSKVSNQSP